MPSVGDCLMELIILLTKQVSLNACSILHHFRDQFFWQVIFFLKLQVIMINRCLRKRISYEQDSQFCNSTSLASHQAAARHTVSERQVAPAPQPTPDKSKLVTRQDQLCFSGGWALALLTRQPE